MGETGRYKGSIYEYKGKSTLMFYRLQGDLEYHLLAKFYLPNSVIHTHFIHIPDSSWLDPKRCSPQKRFARALYLARDQVLEAADGSHGNVAERGIVVEAIDAYFKSREFVKLSGEYTNISELQDILMMDDGPGSN